MPSDAICTIEHFIFYCKNSSQCRNLATSEQPVRSPNLVCNVSSSLDFAFIHIGCGEPLNSKHSVTSHGTDGYVVLSHAIR